MRKFWRRLIVFVERISRRHGRCPQTERVLTSFLIKKFRASQPETTKLSVNLSYLAKENFGAGMGPRTQSEREPKCTSGSVLQALGNYFTKCWLVWDFQKALNQVANTNKVILMWVLGTTGTRTRIGTETFLVYPDLILEICENLMKRKLMN